MPASTTNSANYADQLYQPSNLSNLGQDLTQLDKECTSQIRSMFTSGGVELIENLGYNYILKAFFVSMGWKPALGDPVTVTSFIIQNSVRRTHRSLIRTLLTRLQSKGILRLDPEASSAKVPVWTLSKLPPSASVISSEIKLLQTQLLRYRDARVETQFLSYTGSRLAEVLRGKRAGLDVLFPPETSFEHKIGAQHYYGESVIMRQTKSVFITAGVVGWIKQLAAAGGAERRIRILEIGAGTGSTTIHLLNTLTPELEGFGPGITFDYSFTDVSPFFLQKAQARIGEMFPQFNLEFKKLDIELGVEEQEFMAESYDVVIAADVFHATKYLDDTLRHTRSLLKPGGILALGEIFTSSIFIELSFGLLESWWRFSDKIRANNTPLITTQEWEVVLKDFGFSDTFAMSTGDFGVVFAQATSSP